jgi:hypothetical protein
MNSTLKTGQNNRSPPAWVPAQNKRGQAGRKGHEKTHSKKNAVLMQFSELVNVRIV